MKKTTKARPKKRSLKNRRLLLLGAILVAGGLVLATLEFGGTTNFFGTEKQVPTNTDTAAESEDSDIYKPPTEQEKKEVEDRKLDPTPPPASKPVESKVVITSVEQQNDISSIVVKTQLFGGTWQSCELTMTKGGTTVKKTAETVYQPEASICAGFSVPIGELNQSGQWQVKLSAVKDGKTYESEVKTMSVTK